MSDTESQEKVNEEIMAAVLQVIQGGKPEEIAPTIGMDPQQLSALADSFAKQNQESFLGEAGQRKIGRNEPCPCDSGKKYKKCCLRKHEKVKELLRDSADFLEPEEEEEGPPEYVIKGFDLLAAGRHEETITYAMDLISTYSEDDRLHDTLVSAYLARNRTEEAIDICRTRWKVAREEKAHFIETGRHKRQPEDEDAAPSHFYAPETWLEKYWIALKSKEYLALLPEPKNPEIQQLIDDLLTANDLERFPGQQEEGLQQRKEALAPTLEQLRNLGPDAIPYLLQVTRQFSWATLFIPDLLAHYGTDLAIRSLVDITMFSYHFVSENCLKHLETLGPDLLPYVRDAFDRDKEFDPLKVGLINMLGSLEGVEVDDFLLELLGSDETAVVDWAGLALGKRKRVDLLPILEETSSRIGNKPRISWAINHLKKLEQD